MAKRPGADLGGMAITKAQAADTVPFSKPTATPAAPLAAPLGGGVKSLTVKLDEQTYADLRAYCFAQEQVTRSRVTHQQVMVDILKAFLAARSAR